jgi:hypothetical protein
MNYQSVPASFKRVEKRRWVDFYKLLAPALPEAN